MRRLLTVACILYGLSFWTFPPHDPDLGWHLLGGRWIAEHHDGTIAVDSSDLGGARFTVSVPGASAAPTAMEPA